MNSVDICSSKVSIENFTQILDKLNLYELYNGVQTASIEAPQLGMLETLLQLE